MLESTDLMKRQVKVKKKTVIHKNTPAKIKGTNKNKGKQDTYYQLRDLNVCFRFENVFWSERLESKYCRNLPPQLYHAYTYSISSRFERRHVLAPYIYYRNYRNGDTPDTLINAKAHFFLFDLVMISECDTGD